MRVLLLALLVTAAACSRARQAAPAAPPDAPAAVSGAPGSPAVKALRLPYEPRFSLWADDDPPLVRRCIVSAYFGSLRACREHKLGPQPLPDGLTYDDCLRLTHEGIDSPPAGTTLRRQIGTAASCRARVQAGAP